MTSVRFPFASIPSGWYAVAVSEELAPKAVLCRRYFGQELVLYRTAGGLARVVDPYCPHLGAHLGQAGTVQGETLRCGFHGFCFDATGSCVETSYGGKPPPSARLRSWPSREIDGVLFVYHDPLRQEPSWQPPDLDSSGHGPLRWRRFSFSSHPQETSENSVDLGHFTSVHNFRRAEVLRPAKAEGPVLTASYSVDRKLDFLGLPGQSLRACFDVQVWGLGLSVVDAHVPRFGTRVRQYILATPIDEERIDMIAAVRARKLPLAVLTEAATRLALHALCAEVRLDIPFWENKIHLSSPALASGDGPIGLYRRWARQFYPSSS